VDGGNEEAMETSVEEKNLSLCVEEPQPGQGDGSEDCNQPLVIEPQGDSTPCNDEQPPSTAEPSLEGDAPCGEDAG
jgi:hypothetical protein